MPLFLIHCLDRKNALDLRLATRARHLEYLSGIDAVKLGGPLLDEQGDMAGSMMIAEFEDEAAVSDFCANDPYSQAGLFERVEIKPLRITVGSKMAMFTTADSGGN